MTAGLQLQQRVGAAWQLVWLITKRSLVQIQHPLPAFAGLQLGKLISGRQHVSSTGFLTPTSLAAVARNYNCEGDAGTSTAPAWNRNETNS